MGVWDQLSFLQSLLNCRLCSGVGMLLFSRFWETEISWTSILNIMWFFLYTVFHLDYSSLPWKPWCQHATQGKKKNLCFLISLCLKLICCSQPDVLAFPVQRSSGELKSPARIREAWKNNSQNIQQLHSFLTLSPLSNELLPDVARVCISFSGVEVCV